MNNENEIYQLKVRIDKLEKTVQRLFGAVMFLIYLPSLMYWINFLTSVKHKTSIQLYSGIAGILLCLFATLFFISRYKR